jgi:hypothetical protein
VKSLVQQVELCTFQLNRLLEFLPYTPTCTRSVSHILAWAPTLMSGFVLTLSSLPPSLLSTYLSWQLLHKLLAPSLLRLSQHLQTLGLVVLVLLIFEVVEPFLLILLVDLELLLHLLCVLLSINDYLSWRKLDSYLFRMWHLGLLALCLQYVPHVDQHLIELYIWMATMSMLHRTPHFLMSEYAP